MPVNDIKKACSNVIERVSKTVACGIIDLEQGKTVEMSHSGKFYQEEKDVIVSVMIGLFSDLKATEFSQMASTSRDSTTDKIANQEEISMSLGEKQYFGKRIHQGKGAVLLVAKKGVNIGMAWANLRSMIPIVEPLLD